MGDCSLAFLAGGVWHVKRFPLLSVLSMLLSAFSLLTVTSGLGGTGDLDRSNDTEDSFPFAMSIDAVGSYDFPVCFGNGTTTDGCTGNGGGAGAGLVASLSDLSMS